MALTYCVLASGSTGNCLWVRGGGIQLLVDCGLSARNIGQRLAEAGGDLKDLQAVVCTHGHSDHVHGASVLARRHGLDVYVTPGTASGLPSGMPRERLHSLPMGGTLRLGGLTVETVPTSHDAPQACALRVSDGEHSLGVITDLGIANTRFAESFRGLDGLLLESNHDVAMLMNGPYPERLKKRIRGNWGHLSNEQSAELLGALLHEGLQHVTLGHISEHNNTPDRARAVAERLLGQAPHAPTLAVAVQRTVGEPVALRTQARRLPAKQRQLALPFFR